MTAWMEFARCREVAGDLWHPEDNRSNDARRAIAICSTCDVRDQCLDLAMQLEDQVTGRFRYGVWGGMRPSERARLAKRKAA